MFDVSDLGAFQGAFLSAITGPRPAGPAGLRIYHDTWFLGLIEVLRTRFEVTAQALGEESFNAFGRDYVQTHPLTGGDCNAYGDRFAAFLREHDQAMAFPWLGDLAALEWALDQAHHADDANGCGFETLLAPDSRCGLHPSVRLLRFDYDVKTFHTASRNGETPVEPRRIDCDLLVGRTPYDEVIWLCLAPYEAEFIDRLHRSGSLFTTLDQMAPNDDDMGVLQSLLARLVSNGLLISI